VRQSIVDALKTLNEFYVFPEKAKEIESVFIERMNKGAYDHIKTNEEFAAFITDELIEVSTDGHLGIMLVKDKDAELTPVVVETEDKYKYNYAFQKLEVLSGNVGYLKFNKFYMDEEAIQTVDSAFGFLKNTDAMIIDLRDCIGGSPELVRYMLSHFFSEKTLMWSIHTRGVEEIYENNSIVGIGSPKFKSHYPLFVLVGPNTASAAEIFSYTLKHFNKATIVGEKTHGIAHPVEAFKINKYFIGRFSMRRITNPITNTDWEVVGVLPDIKSDLDKSLNVAHSKALEKLSQQGQGKLKLEE
jgi:C-terminal processing protease CtpA/Prc